MKHQTTAVATGKKTSFKTILKVTFRFSIFRHCHINLFIFATENATNWRKALHQVQNRIQAGICGNAQKHTRELARDESSQVKAVAATKWMHFDACSACRVKVAKASRTRSHKEYEKRHNNNNKSDEELVRIEREREKEK